MEYCPRFRKYDPIYLPNNVAKEIKFEVEHLPHPQSGHTGFQCIVNIEDAKMRVPAKVDSNNRFIVCDRTTVSLSLASVTGLLHGLFSVHIQSKVGRIQSYSSRDLERQSPHRFDEHNTVQM